MGVLFQFFSFISGYIAILILALCIASGLYLLTEFTEEFPTFTGQILKYILVTISILQVLLYFDGLPLFESSIQFISLGIYAYMFKDFPFVEFFSVPTVASMVAFLVTNVVWLNFFLRMSSDTLTIIGFFIVLVWILPCGLFVSLSVSDHVLPGITGIPAADNGLENTDSKASGKKKSAFRVAFDSFFEMLASMGGGFRVFSAVQDKKK